MESRVANHFWLKKMPNLSVTYFTAKRTEKAIISVNTIYDKISRSARQTVTYKRTNVVCI